MDTDIEDAETQAGMLEDPLAAERASLSKESVSDLTNSTTSISTMCATAVFRPAVKTLQRIALYETKSRFYLVGSNNTQTSFRVLKIDRQDPKNLHISQMAEALTREKSPYCICSMLCSAPAHSIYNNETFSRKNQHHPP